MEKKIRGFPNLDKYLNERGRKLVNYKEGAEIYGIPYYSFVRLAKEAGAIYRLNRRVLVNTEIVDEYMEMFHEF